ncbi:MAG: hypothetical protein Q9178_000184 [Gyalolechia marmorata]
MTSLKSPATIPSSLTTLLQPGEAIFLLVYPSLLVLGSLFSLLEPSARAAPYSATSQSHPPEVAPNYFALKGNIFNTWFVKVGWFWFTIAWAVWVFMCMRMLGKSRAPLGEEGRIVELDDDDQEGEEEKKDKDGVLVLTPQKLQSVLRWVAVTLWWMVVTQWFFGPALIDRGFRFTGGQCELMRSDAARQEMGDVREFVTGAACKIAGGEWKGGHDISGHVFILVLGSASLVLEALGAIVNNSRTGSEGKQQRLGWGWGIVSSVVGMSLWMLLMTAAYFHTWFEKFTGLFTAFLGLAAVYLLPRVSPQARDILGIPGR